MSRVQIPPDPFAIEQGEIAGFKQAMTGQKGIQTLLGFRDVTSLLKEDSLEEIRKQDVIREVSICKEVEEQHSGTPEMVYYFSSPYRIEGRIFPFDEILLVNQQLDIIVTNWNRPRIHDADNLDAQPYHDLLPGEKFSVRISRTTPRKDPCFKIFNRIMGFVKPWENPDIYRALRVGSQVLVKVSDLSERDGKRYVMVVPQRLISA